MSKTTALFYVLLFAGSGCALDPGESHVPTRYYDFGAQMSKVHECDGKAILRDIKSNASLQGNRIWYRYHDTPFEPVPYAVSLWSASPSVLIKRRLQPMFTAPYEADKLHVDLMLEQLELHIGADGQATAYLSITTTATRSQVEQGTMHSNLVRQASPSPEGLAESAALLISDYSNDLCHWIDSLSEN